MPASLQTPTSAAAVSADSHPFASPPPGVFSERRRTPSPCGPAPSPGRPSPKPCNPELATQAQAQAPSCWGLGPQALARALEVDAPRNLALLHQLISLREVLTRRFGGTTFAWACGKQAKCRKACVMVLTLVAPLDFLRFPPEDSVSIVKSVA